MSQLTRILNQDLYEEVVRYQTMIHHTCERRLGSMHGNRHPVLFSFALLVL